VVVRWSVGTTGGELMLAANLSDATLDGFPPATGHVLWREAEPDHPPDRFGPWSVRWSLSDNVSRGLAATDTDGCAGILPERSGSRG